MLGNRHLRRIVGDYERSAQLWFRYHFPFETDVREDVEANNCCADLLLVSWRRHRCLFFFFAQDYDCNSLWYPFTVGPSYLLYAYARPPQCSHLHNTIHSFSQKTKKLPEQNTILSYKFEEEKKKGRKQMTRIRQGPAIVCIEVCAATSMLTSTQYSRFSFTEKQK